MIFVFAVSAGLQRPFNWERFKLTNNDNGPHTIFGSGQAGSFSYRVESTHVESIHASEIVTEMLKIDAFNFEKEFQDFSLALMSCEKD